MKMVTYVIRRIVLVLPVLIGVMTIMFVLISALGVQRQLISNFGNPSLHSKCGYNPTCPCTNDTTSQCANPVYQRLTHRLGLDRPVPVQWGLYLYRSLTFQWGTVENHSVVGTQMSFAKDKPVTKVLSELLPYTIELAVFALIIVLAVSIPLGNLSAVYRNRPVDQVARVMSFSGFALPGFLLGTFLLLGLMLAMLPAVNAQGVISSPWCPGGESLYNEFTGSWPVADVIQGAGCWPHAGAQSGYPFWIGPGGFVSKPTGFPTIDAIYHGYYWVALDTVIRMVLPALVVAYGTIAGLLRYVRNSMLEVMNLDYVRTARAKGVAEKTVIRRHAGRNSLNTTVTVLGLTFAAFVGGFPVVEDVFKLNGVGQILVTAANPSAIDFAVLFGSTILFTYLVVGANIIVDVIYSYLDPRVRLG